MLYDLKWEVETKPADPVSRALLDAAAYIEKHGWCQHRSRDECGRVCMMGALRMMTIADPVTLEGAVGRLQGTLGRRHVPVWNDSPERKKEEVITALREAAQK